MLKIRVLNVSKKDLLKDLERAAEFDQSALFKKIYEEEYGTFGGAPFGALIGDYEFGNHPQDMSLLEKISGVAAAANAPFISAAAPELFGLESFTDPGSEATVPARRWLPRILAVRKCPAHADPPLRRGTRPAGRGTRPSPLSGLPLRGAPFSIEGTATDRPCPCGAAARLNKERRRLRVGPARSRPKRSASATSG